MSIACTQPELVFTTSNRLLYSYNSTTDTYTLLGTPTNVDYFSDSAVAGDALLFRIGSNQPVPSRFKFNVGTAMAGTDIVLKWYVAGRSTKLNNDYAYINLDWIDITSEITDNTNGFTTLGVNYVDIPASVMEKMCIGNVGNGLGTNNIWFKCEIDSLTSITEGGANSTDAVSLVYNLITITDSFYQGVITNVYNGYRLRETGAGMTDDFAGGRAVWLPNSDDTWNKFPITRVDTTNNDIYLGKPSYMQGSNRYMYYDTDNPPVADDPYVISYTFEDIRLACEAAGFDWIVGSVWNPLSQDYMNYTCNCRIYLNGSSTSRVFLSGFDKRITFYTNQYLYVNIATTEYTKMMFGCREQTIEEGTTKIVFSDKVVMYGCTFDMRSNGVNSASIPICGDFANCLFTGGYAYAFVTSYSLYRANIWNCTFGKVQLSSGFECTGELLLHAPVAEPLRNPSSTFAVKKFYASGAAVYITGAVTLSLDAPGSASTTASFSTYNGFIYPNEVTIIDKEEKTRYGISWFTPADTESGTFLFKYRVTFKILDSKAVPIPGAKVRVYNNLGDLEFTAFTDSNGEILDDTNMILNRTRQKILGAPNGFGDDNYTEVLYNPFTIVVTKSGYEQLTQKIDIEKASFFKYKLRRTLSNNQHKSVTERT